MGIREILEVAVCILATYGVYTLICQIIVCFCPKEDMAIGVIVPPHGEAGREHLSESMRYAFLLTEERHGNIHPPVLLLSEEDGWAEAAELRHYGCAIYQRIYDEKLEKKDGREGNGQRTD